MLKKVTIAFALMTTQAFAAETFVSLAHNLEGLNHSILKAESALSKTVGLDEREGLEKLKVQLIELKRLYADYNNSSGLEKAQRMASEKSWFNTTQFLNRIQMTCSTPQGLENDCFLELSEFDKFISSRGISQHEKNELQDLLEGYSRYNEAKMVFSSNFISSTDALLAKYDALLHQNDRPLATVTVMAAGSMKPETIIQKKPQRKKTAQEKISLLPPVWVWQAIAGFFALGLFYRMMSSFIKKREAKNFYSNVFISAKKKRLRARIFGQVNPSNSKKIQKIQKIYMKFLGDSYLLNANVDVKIKNRDNKLVLETVYHIQKPFLSLMEQEGHTSLKQSVEDIEKSLQDIGGEISMTSHFSGDGKMMNTFVSVEV